MSSGSLANADVEKKRKEQEVLAIPTASSLLLYVPLSKSMRAAGITSLRDNRMVLNCNKMYQEQLL